MLDMVNQREMKDQAEGRYWGRGGSLHNFNYHVTRNFPPLGSSLFFSPFLGCPFNHMKFPTLLKSNLSSDVLQWLHCIPSCGSISFS